jgi:hypothetical protein
MISTGDATPRGLKEEAPIVVAYKLYWNKPLSEIKGRRAQ